MRNASLYLRPSTPTSFDPIIEQASTKYGVSSSLVKSVIHAESSFDSMSVSGAGAKGLMQLMDNTARGLGVTDSFDPEQNINGGTRYLSEMLNKYNGSEAVALAAYNAGPGRIDRLGIRTEADLQAKFSQLPQETQKYVNKVLELAKGYQVPIFFLFAFIGMIIDRCQETLVR
jgi:soluble lytic murein transglycosylase-like protein